MLHKLALLLVIIGAVHMGLTAWTHTDLIGTVFGTELGHIVSALVGISGVYMLLTTYTTLIKKA
jgi:uncharacterized membrane protein YuzA (DUF378 family)